ncbi:MAG: metallophosphoesterase family protein [Syntrophales bacterium]|nr:metallophosphoesterase family protein [Syntrophales bacterium]MDD5643000.1 metallophosphoesterase family protein [Syntrophales bacterium]
MSGANIYAVGDIHGCLDLLQQLLDEVQPDLEQDVLLFMGDYIDRGPDSRRVVDYILALRQKYPREHIICLKGNHEAMLFDFLQDRERAMFMFNGGLSTIRNYWGENWEGLPRLLLPPEHEEFYQELRPYYETPDYIFVHAGLKPGVPLAEQQEEDLLWIRGQFIASMEDFGRLVIFGHTPFNQPLVLPNKIGIDTGAVYGNFLTCLKLPQKKFFRKG